MTESKTEPRNLSGVYFRYQNPENNKWENWCFEDLPEDIQYQKMENRSIEWIKSLLIYMWETFNKIIETAFPLVDSTVDDPEIQNVINHNKLEAYTHHQELLQSSDLEQLKINVIKYAKIVTEAAQTFNIYKEN